MLLASAVVVGFVSGFWFRGEVAPAASGKGDSSLEQQARQLRSEGWRETDPGVFVRRCLEYCHQPKVYGGGIAEVYQVQCLSRPCGVINAEFVVLDGQGREITTMNLTREGLQGERLNLVVKADNPEAQRMELKDLSARAVVY